MNRTLRRKDDFEAGMFWELYCDLEAQLEDFLDYVPYLPGNENTYSFRLLNLILSIGGHVDSAFKEMARYPMFSDNTDCQEILNILEESEQRKREGKSPRTVPICLPLKAFETEYGISKLEVVFIGSPEEEKIIPFKPFNSETSEPQWWGLYNKLKHDLGINLKEATLQNALHALSGAFLLNVVHRPAILLLNDYGLIDRIDMFRHQLEEVISKRQMQGLWGHVQTPLFIYDYEQRKEVR
jgi:hypothetical protein